MVVTVGAPGMGFKYTFKPLGSFSCFTLSKIALAALSVSASLPVFAGAWASENCPPINKAKTIPISFTAFRFIKLIIGIIPLNNEKRYFGINANIRKLI